MVNLIHVVKIQNIEKRFNLAKKHICYAAEAESPIIVFAACPDKGIKKRPELLKRFMEYFWN